MSGAIRRGVIKVDLSRATEKLRENLLEDPLAYLCDLVRAATLAKATKVEVVSDADDVFVAFDGDTLSFEVLESLFAHLLGGATSRRDRLFAIGIGAALSLGPKHVRVWTGDADEAVHFAPALLAKGDALPRRVSAKRPKGAPLARTLVHVEHGVGWRALLRFAGGKEREEVTLLRSSAARPRLTLVIDGHAVVPRDEQALSRVPLESGDGEVLLFSRETPASIEFRELGIDLVRVPFGEGTFLRDNVLGVRVPIVVVVDADELPTNATRSRVAEARVAEVTQRANDVLPALFTRVRDRIPELVAEGRSAGPETEARRRELALAHEDILGLVACAVATAAAEPPETLAFLLDLPFLCDAVGSPRSLRSVNRSASTVYVLSQTSPLDPVYAPFVRDVVLARGRAAERIFQVVAPIPYAEISAMVELGRARRARLAEGPSSKPTVLPSPEHVLRESVARLGVIADVALRLPSSERGWATLRVYVEGRVIETISLASDQFPMPLDAAFEHPVLAPPLRDYSGVETGKLAEVFNVLLGAAMRLVGTNAERLAAEQPEWLFGYVCMAGGALGRSALDDIPCIPCLGGRRATLSALRKEPVGWVPESVPESAEAVDGRLVIRCTEARLALIPEVATVPYERFLRPRDDSALVRALVEALGSTNPEASPAIAIRVELPHGRAYAALSARPRVVRAHAGVPVDTIPYEDAAMTVVLDDDCMVLGADRIGVPAPSDRSNLRLVAHALALECLGKGDPSARVRLPGSSSNDASAALARRFVRAMLIAERSALPPVIREAARSIPLFDMLNSEGTPTPTSVSAFEVAHAESVPLLTAVPGFATLEWRPMVASLAEDRVLFEILSTRTLVGADRELARREREAKQWVAKARLLARPLVDWMSPLPNVRIDMPIVRRDEADSTRVALGLSASASEGVRLQVLFRGRLFSDTLLTEIPLPCTARISTNDEAHLESDSKLSEKGREYVARLLLEMLTSYVELASNEVHSGLQDVATLKIATLVLSRGHRARITEAVRGSRQPVPTVQGPLVPIADLLKKSVNFGAAVFPSWPEGKTRGNLDEPILHLGKDARGEALAALLFAIGLDLVDVSDELADLVARRNMGPLRAPVLAGTAPFEGLRMSLSALRVKRAEGEVELVRGPHSTIAVDDGSGVLKGLDAFGVAVRPAYPMNLVFRLERRPTRTLIEDALREIHLALARRLRQSCKELDALPSFVREHVRTLIRLTLAKGNKLSKDLLAAPVFLDFEGNHHSMTQITARETPFSSAPPSSQPDGESLVLTDKELEVFHEVLELRPQFPPTIPEALRRTALAIHPLTEVTGECAILPNEEAARTIVTRRGRLVADLEPSELWPAHVRIEDAVGLSSDVHETGIPDRRKGVYRAMVDVAIHAAFKAMLGEKVEGALAEVTTVGPIHVASRFEPALEKGEVSVTTPKAAEVRLVAQVELSRPKVMCPIPVQGRAYIGAPAEGVPSVLSQVAAKGFLALVEHFPNVDEARAYAALLGLVDAPNAFANSVHARQISLAEVTRELEKNGFVWVSKSWAATDGRVVLDRSCPLVRALERWAPFLMADAAGAPRATASTTDEQTRGPASPPKRRRRESPPSKTQDPPQAESPASRAEPLNWTDRWMAFFGRSRPIEVPEDARIQRILVETLLKHPVVNPPSVRYVEKGRLVRFDDAKRALVVRRDFAEQPEVLVVAAALAEINEGLDEVTDAEERRVLLFLLSKLSTTSSSVSPPLKSSSRASSRAPKDSSSG